jgi:DNA processing protein
MGRVVICEHEFRPLGLFPMTPEEQAALVAWLRRPGVSWAGVAELLEAHGSVEAAAAAAPPAQETLFGVTQPDGVQEAAADLTRWGHAGIRMVSVLDCPEYSSNLRMVHQRPPVLFLRGTADPRDATSVAVVGTRRATRRGLEQAREVAAGLAARGVPVISGLAAGIDTAAHKAALTAGGRTVAVIGTGIDRAYPPQNAGLQDEVASTGLIISQFLPGSPPTKRSFPQRNAVMSGYALASVLIESPYRSGARMHARLALGHGRHVYLMRGLLQQDWARDYATRPGVTVVDNADDVLRGVQRLAARPTRRLNLCGPDRPWRRYSSYIRWGGVRSRTCAERSCGLCGARVRRCSLTPTTPAATVPSTASGASPREPRGRTSLMARSSCNASTLSGPAPRCHRQPSRMSSARSRPWSHVVYAEATC